MQILATVEAGSQPESNAERTWRGDSTNLNGSAHQIDARIQAIAAIAH